MSVTAIVFIALFVLSWIISTFNNLRCINKPVALPQISEVDAIFRIVLNTAMTSWLIYSVFTCMK